MKDLAIKDAPLSSGVTGNEKIPVSNGSNSPASLSVDQIKGYALSLISVLVAQNTADIERLIEAKDSLGEASAISLDTEEWPTLTGLPIMMIGDGAPSVIPSFIGQKYVDTTNKKLYFAFGVSAVSDWIVLN